MTYFGFLLRFVVIPIGALLAVQLGRLGSGVIRRGKIGAMALAAAIQAIMALLYTSPWDNYLVAHAVWRYSPAQVSGGLIGYVPVEEYTFFLLEALLAALSWWFVADLIRPAANRAPKRLRSVSLVAATIVWTLSTAILLAGWMPATYLTLIVTWAMPPITIQLAFGGDILWQYRKLLAGVILPLGTYLSIADARAIAAGIWTISSSQSTNLFVGNLPVEEGIFFFATVTVLAFGLTLSLAPESKVRLFFLVRNIGFLSGCGGSETRENEPAKRGTV
jgi:lycopene cyclase domain-containing protein